MAKLALDRSARIRLDPLTAAIAAALGSCCATTAVSQEVREVVVVTAARRDSTVQEVPLNVAAIEAETISNQRLVGLDEVARIVPGLQVLDQGPRDAGTDVVVRGLNTSNLGPGFSNDAVTTYLGEIPLSVDLKTNDLERVEVLIGPQGTLYGSGTLGGAIRYIPRKPQSEFEADVRSRFFRLDESDGFGSNLGFTLNVPLIGDTLSLRASLDRTDDPGFIDYNFIVREAGVSKPNPDFSDPADVAANLLRLEDANGEESLSGRIALRWLPTDTIDATLTYYYQDIDAKGQSHSGVQAFGTGRYENAARFPEPNRYKNELLSLEVDIDLGFAQLVSATGLSNYREIGQRDQTDFLLNLEYAYETFPSFSAFTRDTRDRDIFTQELRLVSNGSGRVNWLVGVFYNKSEELLTSREFAPGFDQWAVDNLGGVQLRPDSLEYIETRDDEVVESALYGEIGFAFADDWEISFGARFYRFEEMMTGGFGLPLYDTVYLGYPQDFIEPVLTTNDTEDDGTLLKVNLAHNFNEDILGYATISEGYRIGGLNSVAECTPEQIASDTQELCALPDEVLIESDTTTNYELGLKSTVADGKLVLNAAVYYVDWDDIQVDDTTINGGISITSNGGKARSRGLELSADWLIADKWSAAGTFAFNEAELAESTSALLGDGLTGELLTPAGSRLPGSPRQQGSLRLTYETELSNNWELGVHYSFTYMGDVLNSIGATEEPSVLPWRGERIPSYSLHSISVSLSRDQWRASFYVDNLTNEYAITSTRNSRRLIEPYRQFPSVPGNTSGFTLRDYGQFVGRPRAVGVDFSYRFR